MVFNRYARFYDDLYRDKDYTKESRFLIDIFNKYSRFPINKILDLGCGTASHAICLGRCGLKITGVDRSRPMLRVAQNKIKQAKLPVNIVRGDLRTIKISKKFDAAIAMFAVLGYLKTEQHLSQALSNIRQHLKRWGLLVFDVWFGPAVLNHPPKGRVKKYHVNSGEMILRKSRCIIHPKKQMVDVRFDTMRVVHGKILSKVCETHFMKYFFLPRLISHLNKAKFKILMACPFMSNRQSLTPHTWNLCVIAEAQ